MGKFDSLTKEELNAKLTELRDLYEEVEEERGVVLGQENLHLSHRVAIRYNEELDGIKADIAAVEELLKQQ